MFKLTDNVVNFFFRSLYPPYNFPTLDPLEGKDLIELRFKLRDEALLIVLGPRSSFWMRVSSRRWGDVGSLEAVLEIIIGDVVVIVISNQRRPELLPESF